LVLKAKAVALVLGCFVSGFFLFTPADALENALRFNPENTQLYAYSVQARNSGQYVTPQIPGAAGYANAPVPRATLPAGRKIALTDKQKQQRPTVPVAKGKKTVKPPQPRMARPNYPVQPPRGTAYQQSYAPQYSTTAPAGHGQTYNQVPQPAYYANQPYQTNYAPQQSYYRGYSYDNSYGNYTGNQGAYQQACPPGRS
jgi:hypothetical protein